MRRWALRRKITLWTALIAGSAVFFFGLGVAWHLYKDGIENLDDQANATAREFFEHLEKHAGPFHWGERRAVRDLFPNIQNIYFVEIAEPPERVVYRSLNLGNTSMPPDPQARSHYTAALLDKNVRVGDFRRGAVNLRIATSLHQVEETFEDLLIAYAIAMPLVLILVAVAGWWLSKRALQPIMEISLAAERITARCLDQRLPQPGTRDEIAHLTDVLNSMIDRLADSFAQATRFTADASHELKTPLTIIRGELESALRDSDLPPAHERLLVNLLEETARLRGITDGLLLLSRADAGHFQLEKCDVEISQIVNDMLEDVEILASPREISVETEVQPDVRINANAQFIPQLLLNLFDNAIKYNIPGGTIRVSLTRNRTDCVISVANTSRGIPAQDAPYIFDRFYRGKTLAENRSDGHGLGLSICREIARAHDAQLTVDPNPRPGWTEFRLSIPAPALTETSLRAEALVAS